MAAYALLARCHQVNGYQPLGNRQLGIFQNRADANRELIRPLFLAALLALVDARPNRLFAFRLGRDLVNFLTSATRANGTVRPALRLEEFAGFIFVREEFRECGKVKVGVGSGRLLFLGHTS